MAKLKNLRLSHHQVAKKPSLNEPSLDEPSLNTTSLCVNHRYQNIAIKPSLNFI